jgi:phosphate transport system protein
MTDHIVKAYDGELNTLHDLIHHMGEMTVQQIDKAIQSIVKGDLKLAHKVVDGDDEINLLEVKVDELAVRIIALRQPVAFDLRMVVAALKISNQVERVADYATNIAQRTIMLSDMPRLSLVDRLPELIKIPKRMFERALVAFATHDLNLALHVWHMDREVDELFNEYITDLFNAMIEDPKNVGPCTQLLFAAKNIERIGDQSTNIAEAVYTLVTGKQFKESDPQ